ncbi:glutathione S-transferase family protein [Psychrosphaera sp. 1_MG-2023]|uniref:Glutathione S-transferase family protein n=1 Tax=Psychrosphaera algicola TaxID=3023714 RepID=A0ABT5FA21_9GAMM|nr:MULTISPECIES: glutathione S-transferase family protein [unclassified Psychrosphaera]MDC2887713.1 glutathione S-transferase family protein [Psychrosphaera sp. G1-22]MDO6717783.1 glutathione S-transferase family protein [Psychrosphaera sp. 1_MG-2023]
MITVHHLNASRSKRVLWLLEELQLPYDVVKHQRDPVTQLAPDSLKQVHPLAKAPVIVDGELTLCESGAVMEYLLDQDPQNRLRPVARSQEYYHYLEWLHFAEGSLSLPVITSLFMTMEGRDGTKPMDGYIAKEIALDFSYIESTLTQRPYFAGDNFTAADIMMTIMLEIAGKRGMLEGRTNTLAYLTTMQSRAAYQAAFSQG